MKIEPQHLEVFRSIRRKYLRHTHVPKLNDWRGLNNNEIWLQVIRQVIVVGGSAPAERFTKDSRLRQSVAYKPLTALDDPAIERAIHSVLQAIGARYASPDISKCRKTSALTHNFQLLRRTRNGPRGFLRRLSELTGAAQDLRRIKYAMKCLQYIRSKGARDFLMEMGLVENAIALDVRVMNVLKAAGLVFSEKQVQASVSAYDEIEAGVLQAICKPLGLRGVEFDRMIYQNYSLIMEDFAQRAKNAAARSTL